jgi:Na+(H+)/acetate symporter ActP
VTLATFLQPGWLIALLGWNFAVLAAAQLTIRLIKAFSVRTTLLGAVALTVCTLAVAVVYDLVVGPQPSLTTRLTLAPLPMVLEGVAGFAVARWVLTIRRVRGQVIAGVMVGVLDPHLFALLSS